ncbi:MAG: hypothetical protein ACK4NC_01870 [Candidatus Gracilibacteria bacterium]
MKKLLLLTLLLLVPFTAQAANFEQPYKDLNLQAERMENDEAPWYNDGIVFATLHSLMSGFKDGTFRAGDYVNRAELANVLLKFYQNNRYENNLGSRLWQSFENDYYSLYFPQSDKGDIKMEQSADGCTVNVPAGMEIRFSVSCYNANSITIEELIRSIGSQFENTRRSVEEVEIAGLKAKKATALSLQADGTLWEASYIFILDEKKQKIYMMSSSVSSAEDDRVVKSFQMK